MEGSQAASQAARLNLRNARAERCRIVHADVCGALPELLLGERPEVVIVDPPRAGLATATATALAGSRVLRVVYVSCDPATFARDLRLLSEKGRFHLRSVVPLDLFPQTGHIELVACLDRETSG